MSMFPSLGSRVLSSPASLSPVIGGSEGNVSSGGASGRAPVLRTAWVLHTIGRPSPRKVSFGEVLGEGMVVWMGGTTTCLGEMICPRKSL